MAFSDHFDSVIFTLSNGLKNHTLAPVGTETPTHKYTVPSSD